MSKQDWIDIIKAGVRALVTLIITVVWVVRGMESGIWDVDIFTTILIGLLGWYFGESFMSGVFNRFSVKTGTKQ